VDIDLDRRDLVLLRQVITGEAVGVERTISTSGALVPAEDSLAAADVAAWEELPDINEVAPATLLVRLIRLRFAAMCDLLKALGKLIGDNRGGRYAPAVLGRVAIECAGSMGWLVESDLTPVTRLERTLADLVHTRQHHTLRHVLRAARPPYRDIVEDVGTKDIATFEAIAEAAGSRFHRKKGEITHVGEQRCRPDWYARANAIYSDDGAGSMLLAQFGGVVHVTDVELTRPFLRNLDGSTAADLAHAIELAHGVLLGCEMASALVFSYYGLLTQEWGLDVFKRRADLYALHERHPLPEQPADPSPAT
jgi:hypothetical protein